MIRFCWSSLAVAILVGTKLAVGLEFLAPPAELPTYQLSNFRVEEGLGGRAQMVFDYTRTKPGVGHVEVLGQGKDGEEFQAHTVIVTGRPSGTVRLEWTFPGGGNTFELEVYFVVRANWAGKSFGYCLVSNPLQLGNPGVSAPVRGLNAEEQAAYGLFQKASNPPDSLPEGYVTITRRTPLKEGMPVKIGRGGQWEDAEVVRVHSSGKLWQVSFKSDDEIVRVDTNKWQAVHPDVLADASENPSKFQANVRVLDEGDVALPPGAVPLSSDVKLLVGTPLFLEQGKEFAECLVMGADDEEIQVLLTKPGWLRTEAREKFAILEQTLAELSLPQSAQKYAAGLERAKKSKDYKFFNRRNLNVPVKPGLAKAPAKDFSECEIQDEIPRGYEIIPEGVVLTEGTPVKACRVFDFDDAEVISVNDDGTVNISFDGLGEGFDCSAPRRNIIIMSSILKELGSASTTTTADLAKTLRTWTDKSGQHKVEARFVRKTATEVVLVTDAGREIKLAINKLSDADQALVSSAREAVDNPFE